VRFSPRGAAVALVVAGALAVAGCGHGSRSDSNQQQSTVPVAQNAPGYCQQLKQLPDGLATAVGNAAAGVASDDEKATIASASTQLKNAAKDKSAPADAKAVLTGAAAVLDKLSAGTKPTDADIQNFTKLEGTVNACTQG
jgi:hypothetical protein